jgi:hypothetical protein
MAKEKSLLDLAKPVEVKKVRYGRGNLLGYATKIKVKSLRGMT